MTNKWAKDALIFELHAKKYPVEAYQEILCEAASCGVSHAVYFLTKDFLEKDYQDKEAFMIQKLEMTCEALDMKLIKSPRGVLSNIFQIPKIGEVNEFGEVVSGLVGLPSLMEYQKQKSKELVFSKGGKNNV